MTTDLATLRQRLFEAEAAERTIQIGKKAVTLTHSIVGQRSVTFNAVNLANLRTYIAKLKADIAFAERRPGRRAFYIT